ncbi:hypothetical protein [Massilia brevitalea]|uniref:hypothetical protein n=1 Tax=Massilia brevitalea TaxID=442526 RepID=UPI002739DC2E|nr:hypothetical protein [Massilia brevitalea]
MSYYDALGRPRSAKLTKDAGSKVRIISTDTAIPGYHSAVVEFDDGKRVEIRLTKLANARYIKSGRKKDRTNYKELNAAEKIERKMVHDINGVKNV